MQPSQTRAQPNRSSSENSFEHGASQPIASERSNACLALAERYRKVREFSERLCIHLEPEDCVVQSMTDASPLRWHLAHTSWFFETFILKKLAEYHPLVDQYAYLFNSYYNALGEQFPRARRGVLSRPTMREVWHYRAYVDERMLEGLTSGALDERGDALELVELGLQHEQQHQELMLTDIKHAFSCNPLLPAYHTAPLSRSDTKRDANAKELRYGSMPGGLTEIGHVATDGFSYDNEQPRHTVYLAPYQLANRTATCGEYLQFVEDGGYARPELWLSEGWNCVTTHDWQAPLYWHKRDGQWFEFTLAGLQPLPLDRPVCHISYFEADAFARWANCRLPTEFEWEHAVGIGNQSTSRSGSQSHDDHNGRSSSETANRRFDNAFADQLVAAELAVHPQPVGESVNDRGDMLGNVWEWTSSSYAPYPGYRPSAGAIGEYNGKFMCNQYVLRGGSCATSRDHIRHSYRNFFPAHARWQFSGVRLVRQ